MHCFDFRFFIALTASHGIASLFLRYFNYDDIPPEKLFDLDLEYFEEAVDFILSQPGVISDGCGIFANCLGALIGHYMMFHVEKVKALFAINFPLLLFGRLHYKNKILTGNEIPILKGELLERTTDTDIYIPTKAFNEHANYLSDNFVDSLRKTLAKNDKHFSYAIAEGDCYDFMTGLQSLRNALTKEELQNISLKTYPKAGHIFDPPYSRTLIETFMNMPFYNPTIDNIDFQKAIQTWGGEDQPNTQMQEGVWADVFPFFNYHLRDQSSWYQNWLNSRIQ